jgi:hypothetical protein
MGCHGGEPGERESAPIWFIQTDVLHSGVMGQASIVLGNLKIDSRESMNVTITL